MTDFSIDARSVGFNMDVLHGGKLISIFSAPNDKQEHKHKIHTCIMLQKQGFNGKRKSYDKNRILQILLNNHVICMHTTRSILFLRLETFEDGRITLCVL